MKKNIKYISFALLLGFILIGNVYAGDVGCPLGPDVTKDLSGALKILKIVAPLLVFGLSVVDIIKAITKGDASADVKIVWKRFIKRCIYAIILFFIPVLVDVFFQMADVWNASGTCDLDNPTDNGAPDISSKYRDDSAEEDDDSWWDRVSKE